MPDYAMPGQGLIGGLMIGVAAAIMLLGAGRIAGIQLSHVAKSCRDDLSSSAYLLFPALSCSFRLHTKIQRPVTVTQASTWR